ncbi:MAG: hypothetical protein R6T99_05155 [Bacteroidales bacterium]
MKGDILIIKEHHRKAAAEITRIILPYVREATEHYIITVAGESGAGKSELAAAIAGKMEEEGIDSYIFQQDDFFIFPPKTNAQKRKENIGWVGMGEVKMDLLEEILNAIRNGIHVIDKPLVIFDEDSIREERIDLTGKKLIIVEGTYTTALENAGTRVFINRNAEDTRDARKERAREHQDEYLEKILSIEHGIISKHKSRADIIVHKDYSVTNIQ